MTMSTAKRLYRSRKDRLIAGICGGLADYFNIDASLVRIGLIIFSLLPGPSIIFYIIAWIVIPIEPAHGNHHIEKA
ncbi:MAG: phage shock protein PspC [Candidatus Saccharibacteria bacterium]|nr:phage shock protein PspC [Candidatus Saccharibacteria bacterium]